MAFDLDSHKTLEQVRDWVENGSREGYRSPAREDARRFLVRVLVRFAYLKLRRPQKSLVRRYLEAASGLSKSQVDRLIRQWRQHGNVRDRRRPGQPFARKYTDQDIDLLARTDRLHGTLSGPATMHLLKRACKVYGQQQYRRLADVSHGTLYRLRASQRYARQRVPKQGTLPSAVQIGERRAPRPQGRPGFLRVDTVHRGTLYGSSGLYHVNLVDEVTQYQYAGTVETISEAHLVPVLEELLQAFPFKIRGFHSDNGSEFVNHTVRRLLEKLHVEFTRTRPRHSNDNALVESKNGTVVRRMLGHAYVPRRHAAQLHRFCREQLTPYLNYHRPCQFPSEAADKQGRLRRVYRHRDVQTPYEKLRSLPDAESYLREGVGFEDLDQHVLAQTDEEAAECLYRALEGLRDEIQVA